MVVSYRPPSPSPPPAPITNTHGCCQSPRVSTSLRHLRGTVVFNDDDVVCAGSLPLAVFCRTMLGGARPGLDGHDRRVRGLKEAALHHYFPNVALAVSKTVKLEAGKVYQAPAGWHRGSKAEVTAIMGGVAEVRWPVNELLLLQPGRVGALHLGRGGPAPLHLQRLAAGRRLPAR